MGATRRQAAWGVAAASVGEFARRPTHNRGLYFDSAPLKSVSAVMPKEYISRATTS